MKPEITYNYLVDWTDQILAKGRVGFSLSELKDHFHQWSDSAIKSALSRLRAKGKIISIHKGYYLVIPPQYSAKGILPATLFLEALMKHLGRKYYLGLLNAAVYHGASHQQPQEFVVVTEFPVMRAMHKKGLKMHYISIQEIPLALIEQRKTESGYLAISNAALTACDLVHFQKRVGGLNRVATVLQELAEALKPADFTPELLRHARTSTLQRLGYLLEYVCDEKELADALFDKLMQQSHDLYRIPLKVAKKATGYSSDNRWNVIMNTEIERDG